MPRTATRLASRGWRSPAPRWFLNEFRVILPREEASSLFRAWNLSVNTSVSVRDETFCRKATLIRSGGGSPVPIQNLNPDVLMVEPAEDWYRCDAAELLRPPKIRSVFIQ